MIQDIQRHLDTKQPHKSFHSDVKLKIVPFDAEEKSSQNVTSSGDFENVTESVKNADTEVSTAKHSIHHKHRHQHTTEGYTAATPGRTKLYNIEDEEKQLNNNSIPDTCYCVPHSS